MPYFLIFSPIVGFKRSRATSGRVEGTGKERERQLSNSKSTKTFTIEIRETTTPRSQIVGRLGDLKTVNQSPSLSIPSTTLTATADAMPSPAMSAKPSSESSDKAGEPSLVHRPSSSSGNGEATEASPPGKRAKIADFATALMRACSVELPPAEREERIHGGRESATTDAREGERMESGVFPGSPKLGKRPTEKIINDW